MKANKGKAIVRKSQTGEALPEGWREVRLEDIGTFKNGINKGKSDFGHGVPFVNLNDIFRSTEINNKTFLGLVSVTPKEITEYSLNKGDVLFVRSSVKLSGVGLSSIVVHDLNKTVFSGFIIRFRPNISINIEFMKHCFRQISVRKQMIRKSTVSANTNINQQALNKIKVLIPSFPKQGSIASLLETWDTAIEKTEALIAAKEKQFKWLLKTLISDQQNNPEWRKVKLGDVASLYQSITISKKEMLQNGPYKVFGANGVIGFYDKYNHETEEIAIGCRGTCGVVNITEPKSWITGNAMVVKPDETRIDKSYLYYFLVGARLEICISGAAQPQITRQDLAPFPAIIPPLYEQRKIASILDIASNEVGLIKQLTKQYQNQKRGLMQKLLTGAWRVGQTGELI